jgi:hypothetical protein
MILSFRFVGEDLPSKSSRSSHFKDTSFEIVSNSICTIRTDFYVTPPNFSNLTFISYRKMIFFKSHYNFFFEKDN